MRTYKSILNVLSSRGLIDSSLQLWSNITVKRELLKEKLLSSTMQTCRYESRSKETSIRT